MNLPSVFDLCLDVKTYDELTILYRKVCYEKSEIERLCKKLGIPQPTPTEECKENPSEQRMD